MSGVLDIKESIADSQKSSQIIGIIASLEKVLVDAEERGNPFLLGMLEKQHIRLRGLFDRIIVSFFV